MIINRIDSEFLRYLLANGCEPGARLPSLDEISGEISIGQLRDVQIEDLLRREPVHTDTEQVAALIHGRRVLVTGAGGSIGSELCRQIVRCAPAELIILGHGENSVFDIHNELRKPETGNWKLETCNPTPKPLVGRLARYEPLSAPAACG